MSIERISKMKLSIIIPVYNSEKYLKRCIDSILNQSYKNFEIILVDDGSTDSSPDLCDIFAKQDDRVKVIHKKNGGTSSARNAGLEIVTGEYLTFMDNDDYWDTDNCLEKVMANLSETKADILIHENKIFWNDTNELKMPVNTCKRECVINKPAHEALAHIITNNGINRCVWSKVMKTKIIKENNIQFPVGMRSEDIDFVGKVLCFAKSYDWCEESFYMYGKGHSGAQTTQKISDKIFFDLEEICIDFIKVVKNIDDTNLKEVLYSYIAYPYSVLMGYSAMVKSNEQIKKSVKRIKEYSYVLRYNIDPNVKKVSLTYKLFGFKITAKLLGIYISKINHLS